MSSARATPSSQNQRTADAVQLQLVDRLARAAAAQLRRAVGGDHDQRDAAPRRPRRPRDGGSRPPSRTSSAPRPGAPVCCAMPSAKKPPERSSTWRPHPDRRLLPQRPSASGAERDPGDTQACATPARASSSTSAEARAVLRLVASMAVEASRDANRARCACARARPRRSPLRGPGAPGRWRLPVRDGALPRGDRVGEQQGCGEAVGEPAVVDRLRHVRRGGDPDRPVERARQIDRDALGDRASPPAGPRPSRASRWRRRTRRAAASRVLRGDDALVGRQQHVGAGAQRAPSPPASRPAAPPAPAAPSPAGARPPVDRPAAVGIHADAAPAGRPPP